MSCDEGKRLSALFIQATMATKDLEGEAASAQEVDRAQQFQEECKHHVTEHARLCPACRGKKE
jgi:hypothetical protein